MLFMTEEYLFDEETSSWVALTNHGINTLIIHDGRESV